MATAYHMEALRRQRLLERAAEARERMQEQELAIAKVEEEKAKEKIKQNRRHHHHKRSHKPAATQKISSSSKKSKRIEGHSPSPVSEKGVNKMETFPPHSLMSVDGKSNKSGRCFAARDSDQLKTASSTCSSEPHQASPKICNSVDSNKRAEESRVHSSSGDGGSVSRDDESQTETIIVSRCSQCRSISSSRSSMQQQSQQSKSRTGSKSSLAEGGRASSRATSVQSGSTRVSSLSSSERRALEKRAELIAEAVRKDLHQQELVLRDSNLVMGNIPVREEMKLREMEQNKLNSKA